MYFYLYFWHFLQQFFCFSPFHHYGVYNWDKRKRERAKQKEDKTKKEINGNPVDFLLGFSIPAGKR